MAPSSSTDLRGLYYWTRASRKEQIKVKIMVADDGTLSEITVQGDDQQVDQMRRELRLSEKGMIYVKGIFERWAEGRAPAPPVPFAKFSTSVTFFFFFLCHGPIPWMVMDDGSNGQQDFPFSSFIFFIPHFPFLWSRYLTPCPWLFDMSVAPH